MKFKIVHQENLTNQDRVDFGNALEKQGKVKGDVYQKADRCKFICFVKIESEIVGIGGIKIKTASDFSKQKANLPELESMFEWELGYLYISDKYRGKGIASQIVSVLMDEHGEDNLMASTEIKENPGMVKILKRNGFQQEGVTWKSGIHQNELGLYLKKRQA